MGVCQRRKRERKLSEGKFQRVATLWNNLMVFHRLGIKMCLSASSYHKATLMPQLTQQSPPQVLWVNFVVLHPEFTQSISHQAGPLHHSTGETLSQASAHWHGQQQLFQLTVLCFILFFFLQVQAQGFLMIFSSSLLPSECWHYLGPEMWLLEKHSRI